MLILGRFYVKYNAIKCSHILSVSVQKKSDAGEH